MPPETASRSFSPNRGRPRIGLGWDRHRLAPVSPSGEGRPFVLGGVRLDHDTGPVGHSDGDALYHAVTDAILGSLGLPDIGQLFPDDDPRHEGEDSSVYVIEAVRRAREQGWVVGNLDAVVVLERPKLGPRKEEMRRNLADLLGVNITDVNIKGKTGERVDATGEGRAIDVQAVVMMFPAHEGAAS